MAAVLALMALAPWTAECVWGGFTVVDWPFVIVILAPQYGGAAVLIREVARRTGGGWPSIALMAAAFGFVQAGLVDQSLFNPAFLDNTEFAADAASARATWVPGLDFSAQQAFSYVGGHVALSIAAPIAIVEACSRRQGPWLGRRGTAVIAVVYVLGSLLIFRDSYSNGHFLASPVQVLFTVLVALALITAALFRRRPRTTQNRPPQHATTGDRPAQAPQHATTDDRPAQAPQHATAGDQPRIRRRGRTVRRAPHPLVVFGAAALPHLSGEWVAGWAGPAIQATVTGLVVASIVRWSRRDGWGQRHAPAGWFAGLVVSAATAYAVPTYASSTPAMALLSDVCISLVTAALLGVTWKRQRLNASTAQTSPRTVKCS
ncbi:hypothetical protein [Paractinoplanes brasiliensis]|uniref:Uncharacterized protein n=1 Tax=Paractinoplanes brasiliensis TaxID=52695 RepID=A0A4R6JAJ0_9ACTN|nr:hypothetical protein [Actinoplanes brasiliensis]TDO32700.1 hypothetical protein C8E87_8171 [Actinoplanes brasiliensis]GID32833.1 hypothetical protein Abr02nite_78160 [Actinoplanes brasiliensis]